MTVDVAPPQAAAMPGTNRRVARAMRVLRYGGTPVVLAAAAALLYLYVQSQSLTHTQHSTLNYRNLRRLTVQHIELSLVTAAFILLIAVPLGIFLTRRSARPVVGPVLAVANVGQAIPSIGLMILLFVAFGPQGTDSLDRRSVVVIAFVAYGILPVLRNTMVGLQRVDRSIIEAAQGMGMPARAVLTKIELPLAVPVILAGIRTALVISVGTVALATIIGGGALGEAISDGISNNNDLTTILTGGGMVAILALLIDWIASIAEDLLRPRGL